MSSSGVSRNALVKVTTLGITSLIEILYARFLVASLGVDLYGVLALATNVIMLGAIVNITVISSLGRFVSVEVHSGNFIGAVECYNAGFFIALCLCLVLFGVAVVISWYAPVLFKIPTGFENASRLLFAAMMLSFIISLLAAVISVGTFVYNRLDLNDWLNLGKVISSRGIAVVLIYFCGLGLNGVSLGLMFASILTLVGSVMIHYRLTPEFRVATKTVKKKIVTKIVTFSGWLMLRQVSIKLLVFADLFVVNHIYGTTQSGLYAVAFFFPSKLRFLTGPFIGLLKPVVLSRYARKDFSGMVKIVCQGMRLVGVVFAFPVGLLCGLYKPIFTLWVGPQFQSLYWLAVILTCHISVNISCYPLFAIQDASNKVKIPSLFSFLMTGVYFLLAFTLGSVSFGLGSVGIALAGALALTLDHAVFSPLYTSYLLRISPWRFYKSFLPGIFGGMFIAVFMWLVMNCYVHVTIFGFLSLIFVAGVIYSLLAWKILLGDSEREFLFKTLCNLRNKFVGM